MSAERGHVLHITKSDDWHEDQPEFDSAITCLVPEKCGGWQECMEPHEVDGRSASAGPWDADDSAPWSEEVEFTFHGVEHEWRYGWGWTTPYDGCVVQSSDNVSDFAYEIGRDRGPGRYLVDDEWDDDLAGLEVTGEAP